MRPTSGESRAPATAPSGAIVVSADGTRDGEHLYSGSGDPIDCDSMRHTIDYADDTITISFARSCLGKPKWIRAGIGDYATSAGGTYYADWDRTDSTQGKNPPCGPRLSAG